MAKVSFRVEGLSELKEALEELPKATGKNVLKRALLKAAEPMRADAEREAPRESGQLAASIKIGTKLSQRQKSQHKKESAVEVFLGPDPSAKAIAQEFGAAHHGPQPYMRPAWDGNKEGAFNSMRDDLAQEIEKARARLARKTARLAAKI